MRFRPRSVANGRALRKIETDFGLKLAHVQSHYLPAHWQDRRQWLGDFGGLRVYLVNEYDIFVSKLSSKKEKHQTTCASWLSKLDRDVARHRLLTDGQAFLEDPKLKPQIEENWRFIFQEPLLPEKPEKWAGKKRGVDQGQKAPAANGGRPKRPGRKRGE